jgi:catechol 2,3-dioxygenase-like lactoylglutathione lyase family enzyme
MPVQSFGCVRSSVIAATVSLFCVTVARAQIPTGGHALSEAAADMPQLHHVGLNSKDPEAAIAWYMRIWPTAKRTTVAGYPALQTDMLLLFNKVAGDPPGAYQVDLGRAEPQSAFWHIGASVPAATKDSLEREGLKILPLYVSPLDLKQTVWRSGLAPYSGTKTATEIKATTSAMPPRDGGFSYVIGPDGVLFELTTAQTALPTFSHVHFLHERPICAENWYVEELGMALPPMLDSTGRATSRKTVPGDCDIEYGQPSWPSLETVGTIRQPLGIVRYGNGSMTWYPRQCVNGRCGRDRELAPTRGQALDHVAFSVHNFDELYTKLRGDGVKVLYPPHEFGETRAFMIEDPDGLAIEIIDGGGSVRKRTSPPSRN